MGGAGAQGLKGKGGGGDPAPPAECLGVTCQADFPSLSRLCHI